MGLRRHWSYLKFLLQHKWYVFCECVLDGMLWRGLVHDLSKFLPDEWFPYARYFYEKDGTKKQRRDKEGYYKPPLTGDPKFDLAWLKHQKRNPHHWQWWIMPMDGGEVKLLEIPRVYLLEMISDWTGAARTQKVENWSDVAPWYHKNKNKLQFHLHTRRLIEHLIGYKSYLEEKV